ncbi:MAG: hypothetical protein K6D92_04440 [Erysipelotrichaceae bacterium]|nr:hypothetical protein [Erysipelotrichaceae bacterium]
MALLKPKLKPGIPSVKIKKQRTVSLPDLIEDENEIENVSKIKKEKKRK